MDGDCIDYVIKHFQSKALERFWTKGKVGAVSAAHRNRITMVLNALENSLSADDMNIPGFYLHTLSGELAGYWSVRVSANWRIVFKFDGGDAINVDLLDYH